MNQTGRTTAENWMQSQQPQPMRVLIVEDDRASRITLRRILKTIAGVEVLEAADGQEAWELLQSGMMPALCFVDINMPRMSGLQLLQRVRGDNRLAGLKVCFCSGIRDRRVIVQAAAFQPDYYVLKPYSPEVILAQVRNAQGQEAAVEHLEAAAQVCDRLGIDPTAYLAMQERLCEDLRQITTRVPTLLTRLDIPEAIAAINDVRTSAQALGAHRAVALLGRLINLVKSSSSVIGDSVVSKEEMEVSLPKWLATNTDQLFRITKEIRVEAENLAQLANRGATTGHLPAPIPAPPSGPRLA